MTMGFFDFSKMVNFTSFEFILIFLPLSYLGFLLVNRLFGWSQAINFIAMISLVFYGMFGLPLLAVLLGSILFNYQMGQLISNLRENRSAAKQLLTVSILSNLAMLGYLKYTNFFVDIFNSVTGAGVGHFNLIASIGVSFYTFVQIGYLIDAYNGQLLGKGLGRYIVFSAFFPCVTAGPLVLQKEMMPQLEKPMYPAFDGRRVLVGLTMFGMGVFKKVVMADGIADYANKIFGAASGGAVVDFDLAWIGALCYSLQLYFDFSGYSDMAIGIGAIFGLKLPLNFDSPFKATNISDFWRRWHMTMTRFFTNYIYTGLAMSGMRKAMTTQASPLRKYILTAGIPPILTFLVAGIWHGAGWTFVIYGLVHGLAIATFMAWNQFANIKLPAFVSWFLTMSVVVSCLVIFRAPDVTTAISMLDAMWFMSGHEDAAHTFVFDHARATSAIVILGAVALLLPNTQQILHHDWPTSDVKPENSAFEAGLLAWKPRLANAMVTGLGYTIALTLIGSGTGFLYYQF
jgi:alginate O-acetyltransferase complex protein AlgI